MSESSKLCVNANLVIRLVSDPDDEPVWRLWDRWTDGGIEVIAPALLRYEVVNGLYRLHHVGGVELGAVREAVRTALGLGIELYAEPDLHLTAFELAERFSLPATYDAHYLALALRADAQFWTADRRLARAVQGSLPWVHLVGEAA